jgi:hypothetical protein
MPEKPISTQEKKLQTVRRILWITFLGITIPATMFLWALISMREMGDFTTRFSTSALLVGPFLLLAGFGVVCLVIYNIFKYRLEKDDDLFL